MNSSVKINSLSPSHVWKLSSFFELWKAVFTHSWILKSLTTKQNSLACGLDAAFFSNVFRVVEKLWAVFTPGRNYSTQHKLLKPKYRETKLKSTRKRIFWALKDIYELLHVAAWLELLHWTLNRLDLPPEPEESWSIYRVLFGNDLSNPSAVSVLSQKYNACTFRLQK